MIGKVFSLIRYLALLKTLFVCLFCFSLLEPEVLLPGPFFSFLRLLCFFYCSPFLKPSTMMLSRISALFSSISSNSVPYKKITLNPNSSSLLSLIFQVTEFNPIHNKEQLQVNYNTQSYCKQALDGIIKVMLVSTSIS